MQGRGRGAVRLRRSTRGDLGQRPYAAKARYRSKNSDALRGGVWRRSNFRRHSKWYEAVEKIGIPGLHFHDLRHTGNHLAASSGASLRDLMQRMGRDSVRAAMIYQHTTKEADRRIADVMNSKIEAARQVQADPDGDGPAAGAAEAS